MLGTGRQVPHGMASLGGNGQIWLGHRVKETGREVAGQVGNWAHTWQNTTVPGVGGSPSANVSWLSISIKSSSHIPDLSFIRDSMLGVAPKANMIWYLAEQAYTKSTDWKWMEEGETKQNTHPEKYKLSSIKRKQTRLCQLHRGNLKWKERTYKREIWGPGVSQVERQNHKSSQGLETETQTWVYSRSRHEAT